MLQGKCFLCFTLNRQTFNILNTHLQQVLEKIVDSEIEAESLCLCFICHKRMQQCYQLMQLAKKSLCYLNTMLTEKVDVSLKKHQPLVELTTSKIVNVSLSQFEPYIKTDVVVKKEYLNEDGMKQHENCDKSSKCTQGVTDDPLKDNSNEYVNKQNSTIWIKTEAARHYKDMRPQENFEDSSECTEGVTDVPITDIRSEHDDQRHAPTWIKTEIEEIPIDYEEMEQQENFDESLECTQGVTDVPITDIRSEHDGQRHAPTWIKTEIEEIPIDYEASESKKLIDEEKGMDSAKINDDELILRRKKQSAERARAYRKRKKDLETMPSTSTVQSGEPVSENIVPAKVLHQKQLNAERCRRYRQKCKLLKFAANLNRGTSDSNSSTSRDTSTSQEIIVNPEEVSQYISHFPSIKLKLIYP